MSSSSSSQKLSYTDSLEIFFVGPPKSGKRSIIHSEVFDAHCDHEIEFISFENSFRALKKLDPPASHPFHSETAGNANEDEAKSYALELTFDYADFEHREQCYKSANVIALCFSIEDEKSLPAIEHKVGLTACYPAPLQC